MFFFIGFIIPRVPENGGPISFHNYEDLEAAFVNKEVHPADLKLAVEEGINRLIDPIRKHFEDPKLKELVQKAYPTAVKNNKTNSNANQNNQDEITPSRLDIRVGKIIEISRHPDADSLYVEKIDVGKY